MSKPKHSQQSNQSSGHTPFDDKEKQTAKSSGHQPLDDKKKQSEKTSTPDELTHARLELEQMTEMAKRTMADLHNLKRRQEDERRLIITLANADIIRSLLPIMDNFEMAIKHTPENLKITQNSQWLQGIEICAKQLQKAMSDAGLKPIDSIGQPFNPDFHEALIEGPGEKNIIIEELEKGYLLGERVLRHAKVKVGNGQL